MPPERFLDDRQGGRLSAYFDGCRMKRNECEYDFAGGISDTDADALLKTAQKFAIDVEAWLKTKHPAFAQ